MRNVKNIHLCFITIIALSMLTACSATSDPPPAVEAEQAPSADTVSFRSFLIADDANLWWARTLADVDGDGVLDVVLQDNNGAGGWLGYLKGRTDGRQWTPVIVAERSPNNRPFAAGDLAAGDLDGDGDVDLIGVEHPGEWTESGAPAYLFWYEQNGSEWSAHPVGTIPSALKDISIADLDGNGRPEIVTVTFDAATLSIFSKSEGPAFRKVHDIRLTNLHEGMDVGDLDGDGDLDIATNGYWLENPGELDKQWNVGIIDPIWHDQQGDWSANATKTACQDIDGDGRAEVFLSHSERRGYPVARYSLQADGAWAKEVLLDSLPAAHSLLVTDIDLDGAFEVLSGVNPNRAKNIDVTEFPVYLLEEMPDGWIAASISDEGVYNLLAGDLEGDGDIDLVRLTTHDGKEMTLMVNQVR